MVSIYLWANAIIYAAFGLCCAIGLNSTSNNLGYVGLSNSGRSEYFTVYGGLQWGLALIFGYFAAKPELHRPAILLSVAFYAPIALHRLVSLVLFSPVEPMTKGVAGLELLMLVLAVALWLAKR